MSKAVLSMFESIAWRYDLANDVLSFGLHRFWRRLLVRFSGIRSGARVLDLCAGTGDLSFEIGDRVGTDGEVVAVDFSPKMIELAQAKLARRNLGNKSCGSLDFQVGDVLQLPFADGSFDYLTIAFGVRNLDDLGRFFSEARRLLKPGGKLVLLEFGKPTLPFFAQFYRFYSDSLMPILGGLITGNRSAYEYLPRTSREFPCGYEFLRLMQEAGFRHCRMRSALTGVCFFYSGLNSKQPSPS